MAEAQVVIRAKDEASPAFKRVTDSARSLETKVNSIRFGGFGIAVTAIVGALGAMTKSAIDSADDLAKMSQRVGVSVESLSTLRFAAQLADTNLESLAGGLKKLSVNMADAQRGTGEAVDAFKALGVNVESSRGNLKLTDDILLELADKFSGFEDGANKTAIAVKIFGRAGADLIPFLNQGRGGIEALRREAERLGLTLSGSTARQAENFNDNLTALGNSVSALGQEMAAKFLPALIRITDQMRLGAQQGGIWQGVLEGLRTTFGQLFNQSTVAGYGATVESLNKAIENQILLIQRLETTPGRGGTRSAVEGVRSRQIEAAKGELERLKQESIKAQTLLEFETPGGLNAGGRKLAAPALPDTQAAKQAAAERERIAKERERELAGFNKLVDLERVKAIEFERTFNERQQSQADAMRKRLDDMGRSIVDLIDPVDQYRRKLIEVDEAESAGVITAEQAAEAREVLSQKMQAVTLDTEKYGKAAKETDDVARQLGLTFSSAFEDAIVNGKKFSDVLKAIGQDIARLIIRKQITEPIAKALLGDEKSGTKGFLGDIIGSIGKSLFGFAEGGSFTVGGGGGTDSQVVAFRATPGERVSIETPSQQRGAGAPTIHLHIGAGTQANVRHEIMQLLPSIQSAVRAGMVDAKRRGGGFGAAFT